MSTRPILVVSQPVGLDVLRSFVGHPFDDMIKFVVDVDRRRIALGGGLHVDAEQVLLEQESRQASLWGGNYYPGRGEGKCIEYSSMINLRPSEGNTSLEVQSPELRSKIRELVFALIGRGEPLS